MPPSFALNSGRSMNSAPTRSRVRASAVGIIPSPVLRCSERKRDGANEAVVLPVMFVGAATITAQWLTTAGSGLLHQVKEAKALAFQLDGDPSV